MSDWATEMDKAGIGDSDNKPTTEAGRILAANYPHLDAQVRAIEDEARAEGAAVGRETLYYDKGRADALREAEARATVPDVDVLTEAVQRAMTDTQRSVDYTPLAQSIVREYRAILAEGETKSINGDRWENEGGAIK